MRTLSRRKRLWLLLAAIAVFSWVVHATYRNLSEQKSEAPSGSHAGPLGTGMRLPAELSLDPIEGASVKMGDLKGKVVMLNFWAGWCGPCLHEMPGLYALQKRLAARGFVVAGINMDEIPQDGLRTLHRMVGAPPFANYRGAASELADRFRIEGLPFTVVLDRELNIRYARAGEVNWQDERAVRLIEGLL